MVSRPPTFKNSWFFAIFKSPAATLCGLVGLRLTLRKLVVFCSIFKSPWRDACADFGLVVSSKTRECFCDFGKSARVTLCGLWAGRPSKTRGFLRFYQIASCATLCRHFAAGRPSKPRGFLRFSISNRPRDPLRTFPAGRPSPAALVSFLRFPHLPARHCGEFRVVKIGVSSCSAALAFS